jgi:DNA protecting protein DprA
MVQHPADDERAALLALLEQRPAVAGDRPGSTSWATIASEVSLRGSAAELWTELHPLTLDGRDAEEPLQRARAQLDAWRDADFRLVTVLDDDYPLMLRAIHQMPPILFVKGVLHADDVGVSVVGSRDASDRGRIIATNIATGLVERGIAVISGLAAGIDTAAHRATLAAGGLPLGVIGTGITGVYPATSASRDLHHRVAAAGALISQFWPDTGPQQRNFPIRNVTMSGLGYASIVVEAGEHSGTRIQARVAVEHGRPVILTDQVAESTAWGRALRQRPGVHVAGSTAEVMSIVEDVLTTARNQDIAVLSAPPHSDYPDAGE